MIAYANLRAEMARKGITNAEIAAVIQVTEKTIRNKQRGLTPFTWPEVKKIHETLFADIDKDYLFEWFRDTG